MAAADPALLDLLDEVGLDRDDVAELLAETRRLVTADIADAANAPIPIVHFEDIPNVVDETRELIHRRGCVLVRGCFDRHQAEQWDREISEYLATNRFEQSFAERYPDAPGGGARIWGVYWSRPQIQARQHDRMASVRRFLNSLWSHETNGIEWFDPDHDIAYPDRLRRRAPGVAARGLRPHSDSPSAGGWRVAENIGVFRHVLSGHPERYDPWDAAHRTSDDVGSPVPATVFRTFQGWTALSEMRPADGVLHLAPIPRATAYVLVKGIAEELGLLGEPAPAPRRARPDDLVSPALQPIPAVEPGDAVWWHGDVFHSVADASNDTRWGNVMYIGCSPRCARNERYAVSMLDRFDRGASPLDFPEEDFEVDFIGRATRDDLNTRGRQQFGLEPIR